MAQIGRARGSGSRGRRFESCHSDHMSHRGTTPRDVTYHLNLPIRNLANSQNWQGLRKLLCQPCSSIGANRGSESCHGQPLPHSQADRRGLRSLQVCKFLFIKVFENPKNFFQKVFWRGTGQSPASPHPNIAAMVEHVSPFVPIAIIFDTSDTKITAFFLCVPTGYFRFVQILPLLPIIYIT